MQTILYFGSDEKGNQQTELRWEKGKKNPDPWGDRDRGDKWTRTTDSRIFSPMLYQLSYITIV